jgi:hypothetical protein
MGKRNGKRKKDSKITGPGGGGEFRPSRARARGVVAKWAQTAQEERGRRIGRCGHGPTRQRGKGETASGGRRRAVRGRGELKEN